MRRPQVNITPRERVARVVVGLVGTLGGLALLPPTGVLVGILELLLIAAGLDLVITGALGFCPLYRRLGHVPASLRR